jgi:hypothetical protein
MLATIGPWLDWWAEQLRLIPPEYFIAAMAFPILLALVSRSLSAFLGTCLLVLVAVVALIRPDQVTGMVASCAALGALIVSLVGIFGGRERRQMRAQLQLLQQSVTQLETAEARRLLVGLKSNPAAEDEKARKNSPGATAR